MVCLITCSISMALLIGMLWVNITADKNILQNFEKTFDKTQAKVYSEIKQNRLKLWIQGMILGIGLGLAWLLSSNASAIIKTCGFTSISTLVNYFYYMLTTKPKYMIEYLRKDQIDEWLSVKLMMQRKYHIGLLLGVVGCFMLGKGFSS